MGAVCPSRRKPSPSPTLPSGSTLHSPAKEVTPHYGRRRLPKGSVMSMAELMSTPMKVEPGAEPPANDKVVRPDVYRRIAA